MPIARALLLLVALCGWVAFEVATDSIGVFVTAQRVSYIVCEQTAGGATQWAPVIVIPASAVNGAGVATVPILFPDGSASAPSVAFASQPGLGLFFTNPGAISIGNSTYGASKIPLEFDYTAIRQG